MKDYQYLMRSLMFVPGHNEKLLLSAARSDADVLLFDIEDSVQPTPILTHRALPPILRQNPRNIQPQERLWDLLVPRIAFWIVP